MADRLAAFNNGDGTYTVHDIELPSVITKQTFYAKELGGLVKESIEVGAKVLYGDKSTDASVGDCKCHEPTETSLTAEGPSEPDVQGLEDYASLYLKTYLMLDALGALGSGEAYGLGVMLGSEQVPLVSSMRVDHAAVSKALEQLYHALTNKYYDDEWSANGDDIEGIKEAFNGEALTAVLVEELEPNTVGV